MIYYKSPLIDKHSTLLIVSLLHVIFAGAVSITDSRYGKSDQGIVVGTMMCNGSENALIDCDIQWIPIEDGRQLVTYVNVSGVICGSHRTPIAPSPINSPNAAEQKDDNGNNAMSIAVGIMAFMLVMTVIALIRYIS